MIRTYYIRKPHRTFTHPDGTTIRYKGEPVVCMLSKKDSETGTISYNYAIHNPKDTFDRNRARHIAGARLNKRPIVFESAAKTAFDINKAIVEHFYSTVGKENHRMKAIVSYWLEEGMSNFAPTT